MKKLLVILDLDETLVHVPDHPLPGRADFSVHGHAGYRRPHLADFLEDLRSRYAVGIWTAAGCDYAEAVVSEIISWRAELAFLWSAERCTQHFDHETRNRTTIKKVRKVRTQGYDLDRVLFVDDSPEKHLRNYGNLIPIKPFLGDRTDAELPAVASYIHSLAGCPDVRSVEKRFWRATRTD
ncbi:MAG: HAD family hydrolase [Polyangiaceae bacterium]|nr:HAD family hydrolase [Polyangiaceae bacterium]